MISHLLHIALFLAVFMAAFWAGVVLREVWDWWRGR